MLKTRFVGPNLGEAQQRLNAFVTLGLVTVELVSGFEMRYSSCEEPRLMFQQVRST
jgi:hypothetical protein